MGRAFGPPHFCAILKADAGGRNWLRPRLRVPERESIFEKGRMDMYRYEYVTYRTGGGFWMDNSACEHREIIDEYAAKGWCYVGYLPTMFSGEGGTKEVDLIFEREEP